MKMIFQRVVGSVALCCLAVSGTPDLTAQAQAQPRRQVLFGAHVPGAPGVGLDPMHDLESQIRNKVEITHFYQAWGSDYADYEPGWVERAAQGGRKVLLTWEPWDYRLATAEQPRFSLRRILAGDHDPYIREWAQALRSYDRPVFLRPMHEMNGNWYPWSGVVNGNSPRLYRRAWRHIYRLFDEERADKIRWVWSPLVDDVPAGNRFERYFPGDRYVDVLALDGYNWGTSESGYFGWRSFRKVFKPAYRRIKRLSKKPIWFAEVGSAREGGNKVRWTRNMFRSLERGFARVRAIVWFHVDKERDWRATSPRRASRVFRRWLPRF